jgi:hypothetical protein
MRLGQREQDVPAERVPPSLRIPNALFVAVVDRGQFQRVEPAGREWLEIQDRIRAVLNEDWDPIGVAGDVDDDEYDSYIAPIYHLLREGATPAGLADYLLQIETERMELHGLPGERRLRRRAGAREKRSPLAARL